MEPSPVPYNLRSHSRVVGQHLLRRRGVPLNNSSGKHHHSRRREPCGPSVRSKEEIERKPCQPQHIWSKEDIEAMEKDKLRYLEEMYPYPLLAMQHYNKKLKEEEHYKVSDTCDGICMYYKKVGFIRLLHFMAQPKFLENSPNSSDDVPAKHFYARVHQAPKWETHVSYCKLYEEPPKPGTPITEVIPLCCEVCGLKDVHAIESKSVELSEKAEARKLERGEDDSDSDYWDGYSDPNSRKNPWAAPRGILGQHSKKRRC